MPMFPIFVYRPPAVGLISYEVKRENYQ